MGYVIKNCKNKKSYYIPTNKIGEYLTSKTIELFGDEDEG